MPTGKRVLTGLHHAQMNQELVISDVCCLRKSKDTH
jgi:hypothetical protein